MWMLPLTWGQEESLLVAGEVGTLASSFPSSRWSTESFVIETFRFRPDSYKRKNLKASFSLVHYLGFIYPAN